MAEKFPYLAHTNENIAPIGQKGFSSGSGGGMSSDMEARVKALEDKFDRIDGKLDTLVKDVSYLKGKVDAMPTSLQLLGFAVAIFVAAGLLKYLAP